MLICTITLWGRYLYHHHLKYEEEKPRNADPEFMFLATMLCCDFLRSWSIFTTRDVLFPPPKGHELVSLPHESFWGEIPAFPHPTSSPEFRCRLQSVYALWGNFLPNGSQPYLLTHGYQLWLIWCLQCPCESLSHSPVTYKRGISWEHHRWTFHRSEVFSAWNHSCCLETYLCLAGGGWLRPRYSQM